MSSRERLIVAAGECCRCHEHAVERITVALVDGGSGPGWAHHACLPCARRMATFRLAPSWLREDLAVVDAPAERHLRVVE